MAKANLDTTVGASAVLWGEWQGTEDMEETSALSHVLSRAARVGVRCGPTPPAAPCSCASLQLRGAGSGPCLHTQLLRAAESASIQKV